MAGSEGVRTLVDSHGEMEAFVCVYVINDISFSFLLLCFLSCSIQQQQLDVRCLCGNLTRMVVSLL